MRPPDTSPPKWSRRPPQNVTRNSSTRIWLLLLLCTLALGYLAYLRWHEPRPPQGDLTPESAPAPPSKEKDPGHLITLFFPLADGSGLSSIIRKRPSCPNETACLQDILLALGESPGAGLFPTLPAGRHPLSASIDRTIATVNLSHETLQQLPGGVQSERLFLAALADTLAVNFPQVQQLTIQVDGLAVETLKGHIDLSTPFNVDFSLVRRPLLPSFPETPAPTSERSQRP